MALRVLRVVNNLGKGVIVDGVSGLLFPARKASALAAHLSRLSTQPRARAALGEGALARVLSEFSMESMVQAYEQLSEGLQPAAGVPALSAS